MSDPVKDLWASEEAKLDQRQDGEPRPGETITVVNEPVPTALVGQPLNDLATEILEINRANGWNVTIPSDWPASEGRTAAVHKICTILALIHTEVAEATEAVRHLDRENFEEELADVLIRVLDCAGGLGINMDEAVRAKLEKNRTRGYRHGGKAV